MIKEIKVINKKEPGAFITLTIDEALYLRDSVTQRVSVGQVGYAPVLTAVYSEGNEYFTIEQLRLFGNALRNVPSELKSKLSLTQRDELLTRINHAYQRTVRGQQ